MKGVLCFVAFVAASFASAQTTVTFIGASGGFYNTPSNWSGGVVPINSAGQTYNVIIPTGKTLLFDVPAAVDVTGFRPETNTNFNLDHGEVFSVLGVSVICGTINADGAGTSFTSVSPFTVFSGDSARAFSSAGANISISAPEYINVYWGSSNTLFQADGAGSQLNLTTLSSFRDNATPFGSHTASVIAKNGGLINLGSVSSIVGRTESDDRLRFRVESGGSINLNSLTNVSRWTLFDCDITNWSFPALQVANQTEVKATPSSTIQFPSLTSMTEGRINLSDGGVMNAPNLTTFISGSISLNPSRSWNTAPLTNINGSQFLLSNGALFTSPATSYQNDYWGGSNVLLQADGSNTRILLASLTSIRDNVASFGAHTNSIISQNEGHIDLRNVTQVVGRPESDDRLRFRVDSNGTMNLDALTGISRWTLLDCNVGQWILPSLQVANQTEVQVSVFNALNTPALTSMTEGRINLSDGGTMNAPNLATFVNGTVALNPSRFWNTAPLTTINGSQFAVSGGKTFSSPATSYVNDYWTGSNTLFRADGTVTQLTCDGISLIRDNTSSFGSHTNTFLASNEGQLNLRGTSAIVGRPESDDRLKFRAETGGIVRLGSAITTTLPNRYTRFEVDGFNSRLEFGGDVDLSATTELVGTLVGNVRFESSYQFRNTTESQVSLGDAKIVMDSNSLEIETLEVGGANLGKPTGTIPLNFHFGQLTIGSSGRTSFVKLVDAIDNGNRANALDIERLYIQGFPSENGLRIRNGSVLILNGIEAYAVIDNVWMKLNDLLGGAQLMEFDEGYIAADESAVTRTVSGTIDPGTYFGDRTAIPFLIEIYSGGSLVASYAGVTTDSSGTYSISTTLTGTYDIFVKGPTWLRKQQSGVMIPFGGVDNVNFVLFNGDADGDNEVAIGDYAILSASYGLSEGDSGYDGRADLNGDTTVDIADYAILSANYGIVGD